ncbi:putative enhancer of rudimentary [Geranomyces variabilis]|nr:putative enhancer of rudimentary [Geranomyces variabilis]
MHTILLIQAHPTKLETRTWDEYDTIADAVEAIINKYEQRLKQLNPEVRNIHYDVADLIKYIDTYGEIACLVLNSTGVYEPHNRDWFKQKVHTHLRKLAGR